MRFPAYATVSDRLFYYAYIAVCALIFAFLVAPILVIIPLSFNAEPYFTFTEEMLRLNPEGYSLRWYRMLGAVGMQNPDETGLVQWWSDLWANATWVDAAKNSLIIGFWTTLLSTVLGTLAALGLSRPEMPFRRLIMAILISPMIVPIIIVATGMFFFFSSPCDVIGLECGRLTSTYTGVVLAHTILGTPFVIITVTATLSGFDRSLTRAAASLGADPWTTFRRIVLPLIFPGIVSGALFAFVTSFDEVVAVLFIAGPEQQTIPRQMWNGIREQISPAILAVATILVVLSVALLATVELLRRRTERLRGVAS